MSKTRRIVIIGGHGNGMVLAQIICDMRRSGADIELFGFLNDHLNPGELLWDWPVLGKSTDWQTLPADVEFCFALLTVGKMLERTKLLKSLSIPADRMATLIHPTAVLGFNTSVGKGSVLCSYTSVQPGVRIGDNTLIRAGANLGHDVEIGNYVDIGPNVTLCGYCKIRDGSHIAANTVVRDGLEVGEFCTLGAGAVMLREAPPYSTWLGNPARRVM
ncbi:acetyltransferase [Rheinheimera sp.]|uniref:acetyltransferase n=1 Tax=Rheinheimera sp. TaxID=1869214 RepID=UPI00307D044E